MYHCSNTKYNRRPNTPKSVLRLVFAIVCADISVAKEVVEPMSPKLSNN